MVGIVDDEIVGAHLYRVGTAGAQIDRLREYRGAAKHKTCGKGEGFERHCGAPVWVSPVAPASSPGVMGSVTVARVKRQMRVWPS